MSQIAIIQNVIEENRQFSGYYKKLTIPATPKGNQSYQFEIGEDVKFSSIAPTRGSGKIVDRYMENGYCYYIVQVQRHRTTAREKDLEKK